MYQCPINLVFLAFKSIVLCVELFCFLWWSLKLAFVLKKWQDTLCVKINFNVYFSNFLKIYFAWQNTVSISFFLPSSFPYLPSIFSIQRKTDFPLFRKGQPSIDVYKVRHIKLRQEPLHQDWVMHPSSIENRT